MFNLFGRLGKLATLNVFRHLDRSILSAFHGKGTMGPASCNEPGSGNAACGLGSATASSLRSDQEDINVIIPECEDMGIQRPGNS